MTKEELTKLKENKDIKFIYKIPCSLYNEEVEYVIIGNTDIPKAENIRSFNLEGWFHRIDSGSLLPYVCCLLNKKYKVKEYLNIYQRPDMLQLRRFINQLPKSNELVQECLWGVQYIKEGKVNRVNVFNKGFNDPINAINLFYEAVDPIYKMSLNAR